MEKGEQRLINWIRQAQMPAGENIITGIGDDMAVLAWGCEKLLITADMMLDGVHFNCRPESDRHNYIYDKMLEKIGWKVMSASLSDCAAMAALPTAAVVSVALPEDMSMIEAQALYRGLQKAANEFDCPIVGGDTNSWDRPLAIDLTMLARPGCCEPVLRCSARTDDVIMVTGTLGGSILGKHLTFTPRVREAQMLARLAPLHAMIDLSDGIATDLKHICSSSGADAVIYADKIPLSDAACRCDNPLNAALSDGEDFELLFCVSPADAETIENQWPPDAPCPVTRIGTIMSKSDSPKISLNRDGNLTPLELTGWEHFKAE